MVINMNFRKTKSQKKLHVEVKVISSNKGKEKYDKTRTGLSLSAQIQE